MSPSVSLTSAVFSHDFVLLFHKVVYPHSLGVVNKLECCCIKKITEEEFCYKLYRLKYA